MPSYDQAGRDVTVYENGAERNPATRLAEPLPEGVIELQWREVAPIPSQPELTVWTSLTPLETAALRTLAERKRVIEIGSAFGYSTLVLASVAKCVWAIDPHDTPVVVGNYFHSWEADAMGKYRDGTLAVLTENLRRAGLTNRVEIVQQYSNDFLPSFSESANFAFIDGDHAYPACWDDLTNCAQKIGSGVMAVHDYNEAYNPGVKDAVDSWCAKWEAELMGVCDTLAVIRF